MRERFTTWDVLMFTTPGLARRAMSLKVSRPNRGRGAAMRALGVLERTLAARASHGARSRDLVADHGADQHGRHGHGEEDRDRLVPGAHRRFFILPTPFAYAGAMGLFPATARVFGLSNSCAVGLCRAGPLAT